MTETASPSTSAISSLVQRFTEWERSADRELLPIDVIVKEHQKRVAGTDPAHVEEIAAAIRSGAKLPPVAVFLFECPETGRAYGFLADGYHRVEAAGLLGHTKVGALVFRGRTEQDFHLYARWKNNANGKALSAKDAAAGIEEVLADPELSTECTSRYSVDFSTLAALVGVSETTARKYGKPFAAKLRAQRDEDILRAHGEGLSFRQIKERFGNEFDEKTARRIVTKNEQNRAADSCPIGIDLSGIAKENHAGLARLFRARFADAPSQSLEILRRGVAAASALPEQNPDAVWDVMDQAIESAEFFRVFGGPKTEEESTLNALLLSVGDIAEKLDELEGAARDDFYSRLASALQSRLDKVTELQKKAKATRRARKESIQPIENAMG
ncbi:ParB/RepB/Spo0J family partition protein [Microbulbifer sp.]|uniref:ParB/RepB/Spo0J family partition protein n=1 Tax=Microbulbifer sp. TaxID=1908541 RepID=UPI0025860AE2|nr:ParB/RepB/Spo0J family partition protein [Microbulbifer sp.]